MSKKSWDNNYKGVLVPNGYGSLLAAIDCDATLARRASETNKQMMSTTTLREKCSAAMSRVILLQNKHLAEVNKIVLNSIRSFVDDVDIEQIISLNFPSNLKSCSQLIQSQKFRELNKQIPDLMNGYINFFNTIYKPFSEVRKKLLNSKINEIDRVSSSFFTNDLKFLEEYFNYSDSNMGKDEGVLIICKQPIIHMAEQIAFSISGFQNIVETEKELDIGKVDEIDKESKKKSESLALEASLKGSDVLSEAEQIKILLDQVNEFKRQNAIFNERIIKTERLVVDLREQVADLNDENNQKDEKLKQCEQEISDQKIKYDLLHKKLDSLIDLNENVDLMLTGEVETFDTT